MEARKPYPGDVNDTEWACMAPNLALVSEDAKQRACPPREAFNGPRCGVRTGGQWRWMPHDLPPWPAVYQQTRRSLTTGQHLVAFACLELDRAIPIRWLRCVHHSLSAHRTRTLGHDAHGERVWMKWSGGPSVVRAALGCRCRSPADDRQPW
jgi:transposase